MPGPAVATLLATLLALLAHAASAGRHSGAHERIVGPAFGRSRAAGLLYPAAPAALDGARFDGARRLRDATRVRLLKVVARVAEVQGELCAEPFPEPTGARVRFLHVPKAGSSFVNAFVGYGCAAIGRREDLVLGGPTPADVAVAGGRATVRERTLFDLAADWCNGTHNFAAGPSDFAAQLTRWTVHAPLRSGERVGDAVGLFRAPDQRVLSAWHASKHVWGGEASSANGEFGNDAFSRWRAWLC